MLLLERSALPDNLIWNVHRGKFMSNTVLNCFTVKNHKVWQYNFCLKKLWNDETCIYHEPWKKKERKKKKKLFAQQFFLLCFEAFDGTPPKTMKTLFPAAKCLINNCPNSCKINFLPFQKKIAKISDIVKLCDFLL